MIKQILVIDDEEDVRAIVQLALAMKTDWELILASSGQEGLTLAQLYQPDVILLDMMMPEMDGRMTIQALKKNPNTSKIPVILVTAKAKSPEEESLKQLEIVGILSKPFRPLELADQIRVMLS